MLVTLRPDDLRYAPVRWVRSLAVGAALIAGAFGAAALALTMIMVDNLLDGRVRDDVLIAAALPTVTLLWAGAWCLTRRDPRRRAARERGVARCVLRALLVLVLVGALSVVSLAFESLLVYPLIYARLAALLTGLGALAIVLVIPPVLHRRAYSLAVLLPRQTRLASHTGNLLGLHFVMLVLALGVGVLVVCTSSHDAFRLAGLWLAVLLMAVMAPLILYARLAAALRAAARDHPDPPLRGPAASDQD
ncbi:MAG: hypothetical protein AB1716_12800 [Planctomycetota bacterium]